MKFLSSSSIAALLLTTFCTATDFVSIVAELHAYCYTAGPNTVSSRTCISLCGPTLTPDPVRCGALREC